MTVAGRWIPNPAAVNWAFEQTVGDAGAKFTLVILARHSNSEWSCTPGQALLAEATEQSPSSVARALKRLEAGGFIRRTPRYDGKGHRTSDLYRLNPSLGLPVNLTTRQFDDHDLPVNLTDGPEQGELPTGQFAYQSICRRKSSPTEKTEDNYLKKGGVGGNSSRRKPETTIPDIFPVTAEMRTWMKNHTKIKFTVDAETETERFINHAHKDDRRCRDWFAAWRNWMIKAQEIADSRRRSTGTEGWNFNTVQEHTGGWDV